MQTSKATVEVKVGARLQQLLELPRISMHQEWYVKLDDVLGVLDVKPEQAEQATEAVAEASVEEAKAEAAQERKADRSRGSTSTP